MTSESRPTSDLILDELKRRKTRDRVVDVEEARVKLVIFTLLDELYAFHGADVKEILPVGRIYYVPGAPDFILGVINVRGDIESVIAINAFLRLPDIKRTPTSRIVLAAAGGIRSGILVDAIEDVVDVPVSHVTPPLSALDAGQKELITGETEYRGRNVTLIDIGKMFGKISV